MNMDNRRRYQRRTKRPLEASPYLDPVAQALAAAPVLPLTQGSLGVDTRRPLEDRPAKKQRRSPSPRIRAAAAHDQAVLAAFREADIFSVLDMDVDPDSLHIAASVLQSIDPLLSPISVAEAVQAVYVAQEAEFHAGVAASLRGVQSGAALDRGVPSSALVSATAASGSAGQRQLHKPVPSVDSDRIPPKRGRAVVDLVGPYVSAEERGEANQLAQSLWDVFVDLGPSSKIWYEYGNDRPEKRTERMHMFLEAMLELPVTSMRSYMSAVGRWKQYASETAEADWRSPSRIDVQLYLRAARRRGATAAKGEIGCLSWLERNLGFGFHTAEEQIRRQARVAAGHTIAVGHAPSNPVIIAAEALLAHPSIYVRALATTALLLWLGALRFAHLQRSEIICVTPWYFVGQATRGKKRTGGVRTPFVWASPRFALCSTDLHPTLSKIREIMTAKFGEAPHFQLPDFFPQNCALEDASAFRNTPMTGGRFNFYMRQLLMGPPARLCEAVIRDISYHDWRHGLPSIAGRSMLSASESIRVGLWTGATEGDHDPTLPRRMAMPLLYSTEKCADSAVVKTQLLRALRRAIINFIRDQGIHATRLEAPWLLRRYSEKQAMIPDLDGLVPYWPQRTTTISETQDFIRSKLAAVEISLDSFEAVADGDILEPERPDSEEELAEDDKSSDASTVSHTSGGSSVQAVEDIAFVYTDRIGSRLHLADPDGDRTLDHGTTLCGRRLARCCHGVGARVALQLQRDWSPRCRNRLDDHIRLLWD